MKKVIAILMVVLAAAAGLAEIAYWFGHLAIKTTDAIGTCAVLVLGYPTKADGTPHPIQRFRVEAGVDTYNAHQCSRIIVSGGAVGNRHVEALSMAQIARELGVPVSDIVIEDQARSTWENVGCAMRYLEKYDHIFVASDSLHAHRGKHYFCRQAPSLCDRVYAVGNYDPFAHLWWKMSVALYELLVWIRDLAIYEQMKTSSDPPCPS